MRTVVLTAAAICGLLSASLLFGLSRWWTPSDEPPEVHGDSARSGGATSESEFRKRRLALVANHLVGTDIVDPRVLDVMRTVPRHLFIPEDFQPDAYLDQPLPIGNGQTISQPYIVALMTQLTGPRPTARALDVGTGSGYQAAVLAELVDRVYSIEIVKPLAEQATTRLKRLGYDNVVVRHGDGYRGWPDKAPFDLIIVAAAPEHIPQPLIDQLASGGRLVIPVGPRFHQQLLLIEKRDDGSTRRRTIIPVRFVPMTGEARQGR